MLQADEDQCNGDLGLRERVVNMFRFYNSTKLHLVEEALARYTGQHEALLRALVETLGAEPTPGQILELEIARGAQKRRYEESLAFASPHHKLRKHCGGLCLCDPPHKRLQRLKEKYKFCSSPVDTTPPSPLRPPPCQLLPNILAEKHRRDVVALCDSERSLRLETRDEEARAFRALLLQRGMSVYQLERSRQIRSSILQRTIKRNDETAWRASVEQSYVDRAQRQLEERQLRTIENDEVTDRMYIFHLEKEGPLGCVLLLLLVV